MKVRAFIAINIDETVRENISSTISALTIGGVKWVSAKNLHLTLKFMGNISEDEVGKITEILSRIVPEHGCFEIGLKGIGAFPNERRPKVIWAGITDPGAVLNKLQDRIEDTLTDAGFGREERKFSPHMTIGRVRTPDGLTGFSLKIQHLKDKNFGNMVVNTVHLMKSELLPAGPVYSALKSYKLKT
ncbi:MAG: RNA 2',3'-cyclic phosphodiesterase [Nitrospirae bacterium YQR-1]